MSSLCQRQQNHHEDVEAKLYKYLGKGLPQIRDLNALIEELRCVFASESVNVEYVSYLMKAYKSNAADWKRFAKFDQNRYTRNLVDTGNDRYNLILVCWDKFTSSAIHDHANSHCFMKTLEGSLEEVRFEWPERNEEELKQTEQMKLELNEVSYMNDSLGLHRLGNPSNVDTAVSLHLYSPPYDKCSIFNQSTGEKTAVTTTFYSIYGECNKDNKEIIQPEDN